VGRNRLIPEYTFMDPRGLGAWNMHPLSETEEAIWAMDEDEAGREGRVSHSILTIYMLPNILKVCMSACTNQLSQ
jgi:hypothetical protein